MRNKVWLLALTLLVVYSGRVLGNDSHFRSALVAQQVNKKVVTGVVSDDMGPVIGATVSVKGTTNGVVTDLDGNFKLTVPVGATLVISFIGYEDKELVYKGEPQLNVKLSENVTALEEVQVIAYGSAKKVTITGALSSEKCLVYLVCSLVDNQERTMRRYTYVVSALCLPISLPLYVW